ncbi:MAG: transporter substrate-binding domain-containing protein [Kiloniellales bacterium]|nr:transporter substrate-binding domain-containing protein [Kiloniellales bacterium]
MTWTRRALAKLSLIIAAVFIAGNTVPPAVANDLQNILDKGVVRIGVPLDVAPFGFVDSGGKPIGLDVDMAEMVAKELGVELELQQITGINRIPFLVTNKLDIVISVMGATPERAKQIAFTSPYAGLYIGVFGSSANQVEDPKDFGDLKIGVPRGTTQDISITELHPDGNIVRFEDDATSAAAYLAGQVDVFATANIVARELAKQHPDKDFTPLYKIRNSPAHMGVRIGELELLRWLDTFIFYNKMNGNLDALHEKWMGEPMAKLPSM